MSPRPHYRDATLEKPKVGDGRHVGYCNLCGRDTFDGIRHKCPRKIASPILAVLVATKVLAAARRRLRSSTVGTLNHAKFAKAEAGAFGDLEHALAALDNFDETTVQG